MQRRQFSREFKVEAVKLIKERGVSVALLVISACMKVCFGNGSGRLPQTRPRLYGPVGITPSSLRGVEGDLRLLPGPITKWAAHAEILTTLRLGHGLRQGELSPPRP
jgi:hypothetical protein